MPRKRKFHQISKEDENSNDSSSIEPLPTPNKGTKKMKKWEVDPKTIYESSRRKNITISKSKIHRSHKHIFIKKESQSNE